MVHLYTILELNKKLNLIPSKFAFTKGSNKLRMFLKQLPKRLNWKEFLDIKPSVFTQFSSPLRLDENRVTLLKYLEKPVEPLEPIGSNSTVIEKSGASFGVRDGLRKCFKLMDGQYKALIPNDTYPVYSSIAEEVGINYEAFSSQNSVKPIVRNEEENVVAVMTNPIFPYGRYLTDDEIDQLVSWLNKGDRYLFIDNVYEYQEEDFFGIDQLLGTNRCFVSRSLAKSHLLPQTYGVMSLPPEFKDKMDPISIQQSVFDYLSSNSELPNRQLRRFDRAWSQLEGKIKGIYPKWQRPLSYYSVLPFNYLDLLENHNIFGIPISVLGNNREDETIVTCLNQVLENDHQMYHVSTVSNFVRGYNKYEQTFSKANIKESTFPDKFFLLFEDELDIGFEKAKKILDKSDESDEPIILRTSLNDNEFSRLVPAESGLAQSIDRNWINLDGIFDKNGKRMIVEEVMARSIRMNKSFMSYKDLKPITISLLPIAKGCQAKCPFCFSHASISDVQTQKSIKKQMPRIEHVLERAKNYGARRVVITGGGEPGLIPHSYLCNLVQRCSQSYEETTIITNGYMLGQLNDEDRKMALQNLINSGLNVLAISRHGYNEENNTKIMYLETKSDKVAESWKELHKPMILRWVCVLQKMGVHDMETMEKYMDFVRESGAEQVCFKELYFSTSVESVYHDHESNKWSLKNQVPLKLVFDFAEKYGLTVIDKLPWGSPIFEGDYKGHHVKIAAYTEPSVFWERTNGVCRSWNLLADGTCYASLEDKESVIDI